MYGRMKRSDFQRLGPEARLGRISTGEHNTASARNCCDGPSLRPYRAMSMSLF